LIFPAKLWKSPSLDDFFCFDIEDLEWPAQLVSKRFDLIIVSEVIEHLFAPESFLKKIKTLLKSEGEIIITTPNFLFWKNRLKMLFGIFRYEEEGILDFGHIRFFTPDSARSLIRESGFEIKKEKFFFPNLYRRRLNFLGNLLPGLFAYQMFFLIKPR